MSSNHRDDASKDSVCDANASGYATANMDKMKDPDQPAFPAEALVHGSARANDEKEERASEIQVIEEALSPDRLAQEAWVSSMTALRDKGNRKRARSSGEAASGSVQKQRRRESEWPSDGNGSMTCRSRTPPLRGLWVPGESEGPSLPSSPLARFGSAEGGSLYDIFRGDSSASASIPPGPQSETGSASASQYAGPSLIPLAFPVSSERPRSCVSNGGKHAAHRRRTPSEPTPPPGYSCRLCNDEWTCLPRPVSMTHPPAVPAPTGGASQVAPPNAPPRNRLLLVEERLIDLGASGDLVVPFPCCGQTFTNYVDACVHLAAHADEHHDADADKPYACSYSSCQERWRDAMGVARHILSSKHFGAQCACHGCGKKLARPDTLASHLSLVQERGGCLENHPAF